MRIAMPVLIFIWGNLESDIALELIGSGTWKLYMGKYAGCSFAITKGNSTLQRL